MNNVSKVEEDHKLVLGIDPAPRGFGFALFENPNEPLDWGVCEIRLQKRRKTLEKIKRLVDHYEPEIVVIENWKGEGSKREKRICNLLDEIHRMLRIRGIRVFRYSRSDIMEVFSQFGVKNKFGIAKTLCERLPVFERRLPPERKPWMAEDSRMNLFDAISLAATYYFKEE